MCETRFRSRMLFWTGLRAVSLVVPHLSYSPTFIRRTKCSETGAIECQKDVNVLDSSISEITEVWLQFGCCTRLAIHLWTCRSNAENSFLVCSLQCFPSSPRV